jgi:hypothetical protein
VGNSTALTEGEWILVEETIFLSTVWEFRCDSSLIPWKKSESFPRGTNGFQEWIRSAGGGETVETEGPFKEETARHMNNKWF